MKKLQELARKITDKQKEFNQEVRNSIAPSFHGDQSQDNIMYQNQLMKQNQLEDDDKMLQADVNLQRELIDQRATDINDIARIMGNINSIAVDLVKETNKQGEKLDQMTDAMQKADENAEEALGELKSAKNYQKKAGKCQRCLMWIILLALIIAGVIIYEVVIKPN